LDPFKAHRFDVRGIGQSEKQRFFTRFSYDKLEVFHRQRLSHPGWDPDYA